MTYEDVVAALEAELGWDVAGAWVVSMPDGCVLCGEPYETRPVLRLAKRVDGGVSTVGICPDRVACNARRDRARQLVADAVTLLPAPDDDAPPSMGTSDREDDQPIAVAEPIIIEGREDAPDGDPDADA